MSIKTAVIGFGLSATVFHIPFIRASSAFELVAVSSSQKDSIQQRLPEVAIYDSAESMIKNCDAELIIITAPNDVHLVIPTQLGGYQHFFQNVAEAIADKTDLLVLPEDALNSLKIIELAIQSSKAGKTIAVA